MFGKPTTLTILARSCQLGADAACHLCPSCIVFCSFVFERANDWCIKAGMLLFRVLGAGSAHEGLGAMQDLAGD